MEGNDWVYAEYYFIGCRAFKTCFHVALHELTQFSNLLSNLGFELLTLIDIFSDRVGQNWITNSLEI